jgi:hypothetical protein
MTMFFVSSVWVLGPAVSGLHLDVAGRSDAAGAEHAVDLVLLQEVIDPLNVAVDRLVLELEHGAKIELWRTNADAHLGEAVAGLLEHLGSVQQRLRRDTADVEAGAAVGAALFDDGDLHAELCRADRTDIAPGASADDDEIVGHDKHSKPSVMAGV